MSTRLESAQIRNEVIPLALIDPHPDNPNTHPEAQIAQLAASHEKLGQYNSVVVWQRPNGRYIQVARHGYLLGAQKRGETMLRADILPETTDETLVKSIMIADNQHARNSRADDDILARLLGEQRAVGQSLLALGTTGAETDALLLRVTNSHAADFLLDVLKPPMPQSSSFAPFPSEEGAGRDDEQGEGRQPYTPYAGNGTSAQPVQEVGQWFPVTYTVSHPQREILLTAIRKAKSAYGVQTSAEALVAICDRYSREGSA